MDSTDGATSAVSEAEPRPGPSDFRLSFEAGNLYATHLLSGDRVALSGLNENSVCMRPRKDADRYDEVQFAITYHGPFSATYLLVNGTFLMKVDGVMKRLSSITVTFPHFSDFVEASAPRV